MNTSNPRIRENYILIYLYERLLFLPVFHEIGALNINIEDLKISSRLIQTPQLPPEATFFNKIIDYICIHSSNSRANFYRSFIDHYSNYGRFTSEFGLSEVIICNYLGLCYLNYAEKGSFPDSNDKKEHLKNALNCFNRVIEYSNNLFPGTLFETLLCAFAYLNKARTQSALGLDLNEFSASFEEAERLRTSLGNRNEFPHFIKMYFKNEMYHCTNGQIFSSIKWYEARNERIPKEIINGFKNREIRILNELQRFEETIVAGQSFFQSVKVNAINNLNLLDALSTTSE